MASSQRLLDATVDVPAPLAVIDQAALWANADDVVARAAGTPVRLATKSIRVRGIVEQALARPGFAGVMSYSLPESLWLAGHGFDDILLAYPSADAQALRDLAEDDSARAAIVLMVDGLDTLDLIDHVLGPAHPQLRICLDVDASLRLGPLHLGVRRSPVHTVREARRVAEAISRRPGFVLTGLMFYDAQIAGLPDSSASVRLVKKWSAAELLNRRAAIVAAVSGITDLHLVNGGGTGSLEVAGRDPAITELAAGSALFAPTLFDGYDAFVLRPAAHFALDVVRRPSRTVATCFSGGYIASGPTGPFRAPTPVHPPGLRLLGAEGAGEVQTPVRGRAARSLQIGDRVLFRHAKAGELCERFAAVHLVGADGHAVTLPTYRGEQMGFG